MTAQPPGERLAPDAGLLVVAVNPTADQGRAAAVGASVVRRLRHFGFDVLAIAGRDGPDASAQVAAALQAPRVQALIAVGGDGMVHLAANAVAGGPLALGIVAAGGGNDFARLLGLPLGDPHAAVRSLLSNQVRSVDCGRAGGVWFAGVCSAGFDAAVNERANRMRVLPGRVKYDVAMLAELKDFRPIPMTIHVDSVPVQKDVMLVAVGNGVSYGGGMRICPAARLDDGLLAVTVLETVSRRVLLRVFPSVYSGRHVEHPRVQVLEGRSVTLEGEAVAYADGERLGKLPLRCESVPGALRVIAPPLP